MSGSDLRFLAERASALEDRTPERLTDLHSRIAISRRRRRASVLAGAAALVVALVVGLVVIDSGPDRKSPSPAPTPTPAPDTAGRAPQQGTCWAVPSDATPPPDRWFDDSPQVPCTEPHTTETAGYLYLAEPTIAGAKASVSTCRQIVAGYLGIDGESWIPWAAAPLLPSREQVAAGASWVRCDAVFPSSWTYEWSAVRTLTRSAERIADDPPPELWACVDRHPTAVQELVSCDQPHRYEQTGTFAVITGEEVYPSVAMRSAEALRQCRASVPTWASDVSVTAAWDPPWAFKRGAPLTGPCFFSHADGSPLPAR